MQNSLKRFQNQDSYLSFQPLLNFPQGHQKSIQWYFQSSQPNFKFQQLLSNQNQFKTYKRTLKDTEISFEANILKEHIQVFRKQSKNFIEVFQILTPSSKYTVTNQDSTKNNQDQRQVIQTLLTQQYFSEQFLSIRKYYQSFILQADSYRKFITQVSKVNTPMLNSFLQEASFVIWLSLMKFKRDCRQESESLSELITFSEILEQEVLEPSFKESFFMKNEFQSQFIDHKVRPFLSKYCLCIVLVIQGYFQNPYYQEEHCQDSSNEFRSSNCDIEDDITNFLPKKRVKTDN